jgi:hypothetical protein
MRPPTVERAGVGAPRVDACEDLGVYDVEDLGVVADVEDHVGDGVGQLEDHGIVSVYTSSSKGET